MSQRLGVFAAAMLHRLTGFRVTQDAAADQSRQSLSRNGGFRAKTLADLISRMRDSAEYGMQNLLEILDQFNHITDCLLYTSPSPRD